MLIKVAAVSCITTTHYRHNYRTSYHSQQQQSRVSLQRFLNYLQQLHGFRRELIS